MFNIGQLFGGGGINRLLQPFMQANAQAMPVNQLAGAGQAPVPPMDVAPQPQKPGFMDRYNTFVESDRGRALNDFFTGLAMGSNPNQSLAGAVQMMAAGRAERGGRKNQNQTVEWLVSQGMDPAEAQMVAGQPAVLSEFLKTRMKGGQQSEYELRAAAAARYGLDPNSPEGQAYILSGNLPESRGGAAELGLNPQYGVDAQGNPVLIQIGKDGKAVQTQMPEGVALSKEPIKLDAGTHWVLLDPISRQPVGQVEKSIAEVKRQEKLGTAQGEAQFDLPRLEQNAAETLNIIEGLRTHPGREGATGLVQGRLPGYSSDTQDFIVRLDQAKGQTFLQAYQSLKGGGQITEVEGIKAENAIARLNRAQSDEAFQQALDDFEAIIKVGLERARKQAGVPQPNMAIEPVAPASPKRLKFNPATGALE